MVVDIAGRIFEHRRDLIDVSSQQRPDTTWLWTDPEGHEHRWWVENCLAESYRPDKHYYVGSAVVVKDEPYYNEEGDEIEQSHLECMFCRAVVRPRFRADDTRQCVAGLSEYLIDGKHVSPEVFRREYELAIKEVQDAQDNRDS